MDEFESKLLKLSHPTGLKLFGEYLTMDLNESASYNIQTTNASTLIYLNKEYIKTGNSINISYSTHGVSTGANVYL